MSARFKVIECDQRSPEWVAARLGKVTGSRATDMLATTKDGKPATSRRNLLTQLMLERITGRSHENTYQSRFMQQGIEREGDAALYYEALTGRRLKFVGFLQHSNLAAGVSLDGCVGDLKKPEGIIELKNPIPAVHLEYVETGVVPTDYLRQINHSLWLTGAKWCDWMSFNPDFPEPLRAKLVRVEATTRATKAYELLLRMFLREVDAKEASVRQLIKKLEAA